MLTRVRAYIRGLLRRDAIDAEVDEELRFHIEMETRANLERGMTQQEARRIALRDLGGATQTREAVRDVRAVWLDAAVRDLRHAFRSLARTPWYFATVVGVIALAMALTTAVLAVVDGVLFKPLPYPQPDRLFAVAPGFTRLPASPDGEPQVWRVSLLELNLWRAAVPEVQLTAFSDALYDTDTVETASHPRVDAKFFETLGVAVQGPGFGSADLPAYGNVIPVVMTHEVWQSHYGLDPSILGSTYLDSDGAAKRVAGILPAGFVFPSGPWLTETVWPLVIPDPASPSRTLKVLARLPSGESANQVAERLTAATRRLAATWPAPGLKPGASERLRIVSGPFDVIRLNPLRDALATRSLRTARIVLWAAVALMLLACLNVAGLAAARVQDRHHDLVIRRALGARYLDLVRLLAAENVIVTAVGAALGVWGAHALVAATTDLMPSSLRFLKTPAIDGRVLALSAAAAAVSALLITLLPVRVAWRGELRTWLAGSLTTKGRVQRGGWSIVSFQVALVTIMAVGGALVVGSLLRVWGENPGFDASRVADLTVGTVKAPPGSAEDLVRTIGDLPGVKAAGGTDDTLLESSYRLGGSGFDAPAGATAPVAGPGAARDVSDIVRDVSVTAGYLDALGMRPVDGRLPTATEWATHASVIVVSERLVRQYWPGERAVGQSLTKKGRAFTVIGVVPDGRFMSLDSESQPAIYVPEAAELYHLLASFDQSGRTGLRDVVAAFKSRCPSCTIYRAEMLSDVVGASIRPRRFNAWLFSSFGIAAVAIVGAGILGLVAMATGRRRQEIGIRMALGATRAGVVRQILGEQVMSVFIGLSVGGVTAAWLVKYVQSYLYKTPLYDAWSWGAAVALIVAIAFAGALIPSLRASRIDPLQTLRAE
jgi:predicted permease